MSQMSSFSPGAMMGAPMQMPETESFPMPSAVRLKRMGERPMEFTGEELCFAMSYVPSAPFWFEINVWRRSEGDFVTAVKLFYRDSDRIDVCRAWTSDDFEAVMDALESYDAARDLDADVNLNADMPLVDLTAAAMTLRAWAADARRQYGSLVGQILDELENG